MKTCVEKQPVIKKFSEIPSMKTEWLWPGRIALGGVSDIVGDQDLGKSTLTLDMAARVSTGRPWPDLPDEKIEAGSVIVLTTEDDLSRTVRPRLEAAGADLDKVWTIPAIKESSGSESEDKERGLYNLTKDRDMLIRAMYKIGDVRLVIVDPISAYMEGKNPNSNTEVREFLAPLTRLAELGKAAIVGIHHLNKDSQKPAAYRTLGSIAFTAAPRSAWLVARDPEDEDRRLILVVKNNLSELRTGLAFRFDSVEVETGNGPGVYSRCRFEDEVIHKTAEDVLSAETQNKKRKRIEEAIDWLEDTLSDGPKFVKDLEDLAKNAGISNKTLERAKKKCGIESIEIRDDKGRVLSYQ